MTTIVATIQAKFPRWMRKFQLSDLSPQEIRADQIALEREERKLEQALNEALGEMDQITQETIDSGRKSQARRAVRRMLQLQDRVRGCEADLGHVSRNLLALGRLQRLVENRAALASSGVLRTLEGLPRAQLERVLSGAAAREELERAGLSKVADILTMPSGYGETQETEEERVLRQALEAAMDGGDRGLVAGALRTSVKAHSEWD